MNVTVVDYGLGNIFSVAAAIDYLGHDVSLDRTGHLIANADVVVLPGVAAFSAGMERLVESGQAEALTERYARGDGLIGLCLGAQLFLSSSDEAPATRGLAFAEGKVVALDPAKCRVPYQGWSMIQRSDGCPDEYLGIASNEYMYFSHSFRCAVEGASIEVARSNAGLEAVTAVYAQGNVLGVQFHPERSGMEGLRLLDRLLAASMTGAFRR